MTNDNADQLSAILSRPANWVDVRPAGEVIPELGPRSYLHAGPPWLGGTMPGPMRGGLIAGLLFEGEATDEAEANEILDAGEIGLTPCQDARVAGPLTGIVTPSTPVLVIEHSDGATCFAPLHEGDRGGMRAGMFDDTTITRLHRLADVIAPALAQALRRRGPIDVTAMQSSGLRRGDECHNRNIACTSALLMELAPQLARVGDAAAATFDYFAETSQLFISLSAGAAKATAEVVHRSGVRGIVTGVGMNGVDFGIRVSGLDGWWTAPSPTGPMSPLDGGDITQASPGQGDSPIIESIGLGAFSLTAAPALAEAFGLTMTEARAVVAELRQICAVESPVFQLPDDDFRGAPALIDVRRVSELGVVPRTTLGFMHRSPGAGRVGFGVIPMPLEPFEQAAAVL
jgi:hypothetical protein